MAIEREQELSKLLKNIIPVPSFYYIGRLGNYFFALTEFVTRIPLRDLLLGDAPHDLSRIMNEVGTILAKIASFQLPKLASLNKRSSILSPTSSALQYAQDYLAHQNVLVILGQNKVLEISRIFDRHKTLLPINILVK